ncbi:MAG: DUF2189 domain-containing protein [Geminicoccaceae bacterium]
MATHDHIRNPVEWSVDQVRAAGAAVGHTTHAVVGPPLAREDSVPEVRRIELSDLRDALDRGWADFMACRSDVIFIAIIYPLAGLMLAWSAFNYNFVPLLFPLISGFALLGPVAAIGLYEMSRRREQGRSVGWGDAFGVVATPAFGAVVVLGLVLVGIFLLWLVTAYTIYQATMGQEGIVALGSFLHNVVGSPEGRTLMVVGIGVGFLFALVVLAISVVSFPMLLDRDCGVPTAVRTSIRASLVNPVPIAVWGLIVAGGLAIGSLPFLLGLIVVVPVLGHATWHLYRRLVPR